MRIDPIYETQPSEVRLACTVCGELATIGANRHTTDLAVVTAEAEWSIHLSTYHPSLALLLAVERHPGEDADAVPSLPSSAAPIA